MAYCPKCGKKVFKEDAFCRSCGSDLSSSQFEDQENSRSVFQGDLKKCPSCGAAVNSMLAICPECGYEINSRSVPESIQKFVDGLHRYDSSMVYDVIASEDNTGWKSWSGGAKFMWVILNMYTLCIPLIIYLFTRQNNGISIKEKEKKSYIENYVFPNEREVVIEALLFIKSQIENMLTEKSTEHIIFWNKVWMKKATQIHQKANIIMKNDSVESEVYNGIINSFNMIKRKDLIQKLIYAGIGVLLIIIIFVCNMV